LCNNRFYHPGLLKYACVADEKETYLQLKDQETIETGGDDDHRPDTFTVIGLKYLKDMPQHVVIKGDNGLYLSRKIYIPFSVTQLGGELFLRALEELPRYLQFGEEDKRYSLRSLCMIF
jgi:hypothetical protein